MTKKHLCDFCSSPSPITAFPVAYDAMVGINAPGKVEIHMSQGPWAACMTCAEFIRNNDAEGLAQHASLAFNQVVSMPLDVLLGYVRKVHHAFWDSRDPTKPEVPYL